MNRPIIGKLFPIPIDDYPRLLRYKVTQSGIHYIEDLMREIYIEKKELSINKLTQLGLLLKTYICQTKRIEDELLFQEISELAKKYGGVQPEYIKTCIKNLIMRGLLGPNPYYDPQLAVDIHTKNT
jgi:hypothetical protein